MKKRARVPVLRTRAAKPKSGASVTVRRAVLPIRDSNGKVIEGYVATGTLTIGCETSRIEIGGRYEFEAVLRCLRALAGGA